MFATDRIAGSAEDAWLLTLRHLLDHGVDVPGEAPSRELLGFDVVVEDPRRRVVMNSVRPLAIVPAVARFVWMMEGNDRLEDIAFYEPLVRRYTDDMIAVPGSNYGARLRRPYAGTDQVVGAIARLTGSESGADGALRRAANVIWRPDDAVRDSNDIPCAFGVFYSPRGGRIVTQLVMRSNNAMSLLPFNVFEFSLLAEVVATQSGHELGPFRIEAASMHLYTRDIQRAKDVLGVDPASSPSMPHMPASPAPLGQINLLARCEGLMRHEQRALHRADAGELRKRGEGLAPYWQAFFEVLLAHAAEKAGNSSAADALVESLPSYFGPSVASHLSRLRARAAPGDDGRLFVLPEASPPAGVSAAVRNALRDPAGHDAVDHIHRLLDELEADGIHLSRTDAQRVVRHLRDRPTPAFARSETQGRPDDFKRVSKDELLVIVRALGLAR